VSVSEKGQQPKTNCKNIARLSACFLTFEEEISLGIFIGIFSLPNLILGLLDIVAFNFRQKNFIHYFSSVEEKKRKITFYFWQFFLFRF
jgi:hypothetical protein